MTEKALVNLTSMDFFEIKENLKNFLKSQDEFKDYNFEGSGLNILLDLLAYNSQHTAYLANMLANESEIDTAILRANVVSRAKLLGYVPKSTTASRAIISISLRDSNNKANSLLLPRGTKFIAKSSSKQYIFVTLEDYNLKLNDSGEYRNDEIEIFEGNIKSFSFDVTSHDRRYIIPSKKIDTKTLKVCVFDNPNSSNFEVYEQAFGIRKIDSNSNVFWVYETDGNYYEIKFGDGIFGKQPKINGVVYCEYLESDGSEANDISRFSLVGSFEGYENSEITIKTISPSSGGSEIETTSSIKINAPRFFQSQNRAVTKEDYISVVNDVYPYAKSVAVWGGDEISPPKFGKVFISIIPKNKIKLTSTNKRYLERKIKERAVAGITPIIIDPRYINLNMTVFVTVRKNAIDGLGSFAKRLEDNIKQYFNDTFGIFNNVFYYSNLLAEIKNYSRAIIGVRAEYTMSIEDSLEQENYAFENSIIPGTVRTNKVRLEGKTEFYSIEDYKKDGNLYVHEEKIGTVNYETGRIYINTSKIKETSKKTHLEIFATPLNDDIIAGFASAIILNTNRLSVELITN